LNRRVRIGIIIAAIGIVLVILGVVFLSRFVTQSLTPLPPPTPIPITNKVLITTHDLAAGTLLRAEDLSVLEVPIGIAPRDAMDDIDNAIGKFTKVALISGEMVLEHHLADPTNVSHDQAFLIADNQVMMAFPATDLLSTLKILQPGDAVDILVSIPQSVQPQEPGLGEQTLAGEEEVGEETRLFTFDSMQAVNIQAVVIDIIEENEGRTSTSGAVNTSPSAVPTPSPSEYNIKDYLLALSPQDALILKHLRDAGGNFDLVLRSPTSNQLFDISPVFSEYVIEKYNLEIEK
jgi:pilus assembly protein CpaB